jgi:stress-induced morphogen
MLTIPVATLVAGDSNMPSPDAIRARLVSAFPEAHVEVTDLTGTQDHFQALVVSRDFHGKSRVDQHKMVYAALGELMSGAIHALALTTRSQDRGGEKQEP